jgi:hypothetical protein
MKPLKRQKIRSKSPLRGWGGKYTKPKIDTENTPMVTIDVPGDVHSQSSMTSLPESLFKSPSKEFPLSNISVDANLKKPSEKATGKRINQEGVEYYNEFNRER